MKKTLIATFAAVLSLGAIADEELVKLGDDIAMPKSMNAKVGMEGLPCVAIQVPHSKGGFLSVSCGKSSNVSSEDAITKLQAAMAKLGDKLVRFRVGDATFYGFYCKECGGYEGHVVAMGGYSAIFVFPPKGSGLDGESLDILKKVVFLPQKGFAIESAVKLYGPNSKMKPATKFPVLKKMVEARPESVELIALLKDVAKETGNTATEAWCEAELNRLDPEVYGNATKSVPTFDFTCEKGNKIIDSLRIDDTFEKKTVTIPTGRVAMAKAEKPAGKATATGNKTKTITLPGGATMEMIWCPSGTYMMGSPKTEKGRANRERQIKVTLTKGFWLSKYEVTQRQYKSVIGKNPSKVDFQDDDLPVGCITWPLADEFCKAVGQGARLPTSAEWEYACRAGTTTAFPWGETCNGKEANCNGTLPCGTDEEGPNLERPVNCGSYPANPWGFCDMNGNMLEWCFDRDQSYGSNVKELVDPKGGEEETYRVLRGGSFQTSASGCRSAWRDSDSPSQWSLYVDRGFRLAMDE